MKSVDIEKNIKTKNRKIEEMRKEICILSIEVENDNKLLKSTKEQERENKEIDFFKSIGVEDFNSNDVESNQKVNDMFIVFTKKAEFVRVTNPGEFQNFSEFENWLKKEKLYGHRLSSFCSRHYEWYDWSLREKLENLCWEFTKSGNLKGTSW
jgi:hypothetical protein